MVCSRLLPRHSRRPVQDLEAEEPSAEPSEADWGEGSVKDRAAERGRAVERKGKKQSV